MSEQDSTAAHSKSAIAKQQQGDRIAAVNNWRGQCLDNFARAEQAIVRASERLAPIALEAPFKLEEAASNRTRTLRDGLKGNWPKVPRAIRLATLLDQWSIREKQRNDLVHGCFTVKPGIESAWLLLNELVSVKKGVVMIRRDIRDVHEADAFLRAVVAERKQLETALEEIAVTLKAA